MGDVGKFLGDAALNGAKDYFGNGGPYGGGNSSMMDAFNNLFGKKEQTYGIDETNKSPATNQLTTDNPNYLDTLLSSILHDRRGY